MKYKITTELEKLGVKPISEESNFLRFAIDGYSVDYVEEDRECLAFLSNVEKSNLYAVLVFTPTSGGESKYKYALRLSSGVSSKEIAEWVHRKLQNPERDTTKLEEVKKRIEALGYDWLVKERVMNIAMELEDYRKLRVDSLVINYNDIITDDHMLIQIKTLLDQPHQPQLYLLKTIELSDSINISEEEFDEKDLESIIKRAIMFKYLELEESASGGDEDKIRERTEKL